MKRKGTARRIRGNAEGKQIGFKSYGKENSAAFRNGNGVDPGFGFPPQKGTACRIGNSVQGLRIPRGRTVRRAWMMTALENACAKAEEVAGRFPEALVIGADTVIEFENEILGKPRDLAEAEKILEKLAGKTHRVTTGCAVRCCARNIRIRFAETSAVTFRPFGRETIREYLSNVPVLDKAGAYAIQDHGEMIIERYEGELENIIGLPVARLAETVKLLFS